MIFRVHNIVCIGPITSCTQSFLQLTLYLGKFILDHLDLQSSQRVGPKSIPLQAKSLHHVWVKPDQINSIFKALNTSDTITAQSSSELTTCLGTSMLDQCLRARNMSGHVYTTSTRSPEFAAYPCQIDLIFRACNAFLGILLPN